MSSSLLHWETSDFPNGKAQFSWELRGRAPSRCYHCLLVCQDWFSDQCELGLFRKGINLRLFRLRYKRGAKGIRLKKTRKLETAEFELKAGRVALSVPRAWGWYFPNNPAILASFIYYFCLYLLCGGQFPAGKAWAVMGCPQLATWVALLLWSMEQWREVIEQCPWTACSHVQWAKSQSLWPTLAQHCKTWAQQRGRERTERHPVN